jgi:hypothetical protein
MKMPDADTTVEVVLKEPGNAGSKLSPTLTPFIPPSIPSKPKNDIIHVSAAVLDAARKNGEELLKDL